MNKAINFLFFAILIQKVSLCFINSPSLFLKGLILVIDLFYVVHAGQIIVLNKSS